MPKTKFETELSLRIMKANTSTIPKKTIKQNSSNTQIRRSSFNKKSNNNIHWPYLVYSIIL